MEARPDIEGVDCQDIDLKMIRSSGFYQLDFPNGYRAEGTAGHLLSLLHMYHYNESRREFPTAPLIHAGSIKTSDGYAILVGEKEFGKTTLLLRLAIAGVSVVGDEHIFFDGNRSIPRPRTMRVKEGSLRYLEPKQAEQVAAAPKIKDWTGSSIFSIAPNLFCGTWSFCPAPIKTIIVLRPNHGGQSSFRKLSPEEAMGPVLKNTILPESGRLSGLANIRQLCFETANWELTLGGLVAAEKLLYELTSSYA